MPNHASMGGVPEYLQRQIDNKTVDMSDYYTKEEVDEKIEDIDLTDYYTKSEIDEKLENVETVLYPQIMEFYVNGRDSNYYFPSNKWDKTISVRFSLNTIKLKSLKLTYNTTTNPSATTIDLDFTDTSYSFEIADDDILVSVNLVAITDVGTASKTIKFRKVDDVYTGISPIPESYDASFIKGNLYCDFDFFNSYLDNTTYIEQSEQENVRDDNYLYLAISESQASDGFITYFDMDRVEMVLCDTVDLDGVNYNIYRSAQKNLGAFFLKVILNYLFV